MSKNASKGSATGEPTPVKYLTPFPFGAASDTTDNNKSENGDTTTAAAAAHTKQVGPHLYKIPTAADFYAFREFADSLDDFKLVYSAYNDCAVWERKIEGEPFRLIKVFGVFLEPEPEPGQGQEGRGAGGKKKESHPDKDKKKEEEKVSHAGKEKKEEEKESHADKDKKKEKKSKKDMTKEEKKEYEAQKKREKEEKKKTKKEEKKAKKDKKDKKKDSKHVDPNQGAKTGEGAAAAKEANTAATGADDAAQQQQNKTEKTKDGTLDKGSDRHTKADGADADSPSSSSSCSVASFDSSSSSSDDEEEDGNAPRACAPAELYNVIQDPVYRPEWDKFRLEAHRIVLLANNSDLGYYAAKSPVPMVANRDFVNQRSWHVSKPSSSTDKDNNTNNNKNADGGEEEKGSGGAQQQQQQQQQQEEEYIIFNTSVPVENYGEDYQKVKNNNKHGSFVRSISKLTGYLIQPFEMEVEAPASGGDKKTILRRGACITYLTWADPRGWLPTSLTNYISSKYAPNTIKTLREALLKYGAYRTKLVADLQAKQQQQQKKGKDAAADHNNNDNKNSTNVNERIQEDRDWLIDQPPTQTWQEALQGSSNRNGKGQVVKVEYRTRTFVQKMWAEEAAKKHAKK